MSNLSNLKLIVGVVLAAALLVGIYLLAPRCEQPTEIEVAFTQLACAQGVDIETFSAEACEKLHGESNCEFQETDRDALFKMFTDKVNDCTVKKLKADNKCVDKYEAI